MIYQGTDANTTGTGTQIGTNTFSINSDTYDNNGYVGYMYTIGSVHGLGTNSGVKTVLDQWYQNNLQSHADKIEGNAGFCGNGVRGSYTYTSGGGTGTTQTYYGAYTRLETNNAANASPTFECENESDLYTTDGSGGGNGALTYPIGLITADEAAYAGGVNDSYNQSYYLYTGQDYLTMSSSYAVSASMYRVQSNGRLYTLGVHAARGIRPVINLKADVTISSGNGTSSQPYVIS